jgi:hypothetical protein|tara:strand:+ start:386 stop:841 length:456 start_codon:yes stop_codon:yes gene_type:complete
MIVGDKLMVFHAGAVDSSSVTSADDGTNIDLCALPASAITSVFAEEDFVYVYFKDAGRFEAGQAFSGVTNDTSDDVDQAVMHEIMEQTFVRLGVNEGTEADVVKDFAALATASGTAGNTQVPVFDAVNSSFPINNVTSVQIRRHLTAHTVL